MKNPKRSEKKTNKLNTLLELRSQKDFELNVKETEKIGTRTKRDNSGYNLPVFDNFKSKMLGELRRVKYKGLEDMVYRMELTYDEILGIPDRKEFAGSTFGYTLPPGYYKSGEVYFVVQVFTSRWSKSKGYNCRY